MENGVEPGVLGSREAGSRPDQSTHAGNASTNRNDYIPRLTERGADFAGPSMGLNASELPPVDTGYGAWSFVASAFVIDTLVWGFAYTYGVFQEYFLRNKTFGDASEAALGAVGTVALAMEYFVTMVVILAAQQWRHRIPAMMWSGLGISCASLLVASFTSQIWQFVLIQGVCFGIGAGSLYAPVFVYLPEWFSARKGLATAVIFAGAAAGGTLYPLVLSYLLEKLGPRWTLRIWAGYMFAASVVSLMFMKPRLPTSRPSATHGASLFTRIKMQHWSFLSNPLFICVSITTFIQALAYFPVSLYMSVYTTSLGLPPIHGTIVLSVFNLASALGQVLFGYLCDVAPYPYVIVASGAGASLAAYLLWGFAHTRGIIFAFVVLFGSLSGGFTSMWPAATTEILGPDHQGTTSTVMGALGIVKGLAAIVGPFVAASLHHPQDSAVRTVYSGYGFRDVTLFGRFRDSMEPSVELGVLGSVSSRSRFEHGTPTSRDVSTTRDDSTSRFSGRETAFSDPNLGVNTSELPPVDTGYGAWSFVASAFVLDTLVWGFSYTYGVFQEYFMRNKTFGNASEASLGAVGTVALAMEYFVAMTVILAAQQWRHRIPAMMWTSLAVSCASLVCASFATQAGLPLPVRISAMLKEKQIWQFVLIQGVCFGIGAGGLYAPVVVYVSEWFSARKGLATAIIFAGAAAGGTLYPLVLGYLLEKLGFRWALRIWAAYMFVASGISLLFMKPRLPIGQSSATHGAGLLTRIRLQHWSFLSSPLFICVGITTFVQSLAYFPVSLYMSVYTTSLGLPPINGTIVLAVFNLASALGQVIFGHLCDITPYPYVIVGSGAGASLAAYLLWGFAHCLGIIFAFVVLFGSLSGGFTSMWPAASTEILGPDHRGMVSTVMGTLGIVKGIAAIVGPFVAASLHHPHDSAVRTVYSGYGFRDVTLFVGSMMLATAAGGVSIKLASRR